ncbi:MAG: hypothetical protein U5K37_01440 [Natrialbaceae archaeon]|nr:hypothetical protein [Natrialbaceae archaeon]
MTRVPTRLTTVLAAVTILMFVFAVGAFATTTAAQGAADEPTYEINIANDGQPHAVGFPGPINGTINDSFVAGFDGVESIFVYQNGDWARLQWDDLNESPQSMEALIVTTDGVGPQSIPLEITFERNLSPADRSLSQGWNMLSAKAFNSAEDSFGQDVNETVIVLDRYGGISSPEMPVVSSSLELHYRKSAVDWFGTGCQPIQGIFRVS